MRSPHYALLSLIKPHRPRLVLAAVIVSLFCWTAACLGANYLEEERLDSAAGILDREWRINLIRLATRDYLRTRSQTKTGLPNYDQLLENTRLAPALLYDQLTAKPAAAARSAAPAGSSPSAPPAAPSAPAGSSPSAAPSAPAGSSPSTASGGQQGASPGQGTPSAPADSSTPSTIPSQPLPDLSPPTLTLPPGASIPALPPISGPGPSVIP